MTLSTFVLGGSERVEKKLNIKTSHVKMRCAQTWSVQRIAHAHHAGTPRTHSRMHPYVFGDLWQLRSRNVESPIMLT